MVLISPFSIVLYNISIYRIDIEFELIVYEFLLKLTLINIGHQYQTLISSNGLHFHEIYEKLAVLVSYIMVFFDIHAKPIVSKN